MNAALFVDQAGELAGKMVAREMRGPGDIENAMRRIEGRHGIPYQSLWALRYRRPKEISAHVFFQICAAYDAECERQRKLLEHERKLVDAKGFLASALVRAADFVAGEEG